MDALHQLVGVTEKGSVMAALRRALKEPPAPLPVAAGPGRLVTPAAPGSPPAQATAVHPLDERGRAYLVEQRHLDPATVDAFSDQLAENEHGSVRAFHNDHQDGEERGPGWKSFVGNQAQGEGRGRSIWRARPPGCRAPTCILVAESFISALSAWESLSDDQRQRTMIVSTAGSFAAAGLARLEKLVAWAHRQALGRKLWLLNASDQDEAQTDQRAAVLRDVAERMGISYHRYAPPEASQDWSDALARSKGYPTHAEAQEAQERAYATDMVRAYIHTDPEPAEEILEVEGEGNDGLGTPGGRGRGR